jgi:hypothetical protein
MTAEQILTHIEAIIEQHCNQSSREAHLSAATEIWERFDFEKTTALREENERLRARVNEAETAAAKLILAVQAKVPNIFTDSEVDMNLYTSIHELKGILNK